MTLFNETGAMSLYVRQRIEVKRLFVTVTNKFSKNENTNDFEINFLDKTVDICKFSQNRRYEPLIQLVYRITSEKINLPQRCPIKKVFANFDTYAVILFSKLCSNFQGDIFYADNYIFETDQFPPVFPPNRMYLYLAFSTLKGEQLDKMYEMTFVGRVHT